jgi:hypothetical protein
MSKLEPHGSVLATGLHPLVSETASHVSECLRLRLAPNRLMSLMQELLSKANIMSALATVLPKPFSNPPFQLVSPNARFTFKNSLRQQ